MLEARAGSVLAVGNGDGKHSGPHATPSRAQSQHELLAEEVLAKRGTDGDGGARDSRMAGTVGNGDGAGEHSASQAICS